MEWCDGVPEWLTGTTANRDCVGSIPTSISTFAVHNTSAELPTRILPEGVVLQANSILSEISLDWVANLRITTILGKGDCGEVYDTDIHGEVVRVARLPADQWAEVSTILSYFRVNHTSCVANVYDYGVIASDDNSVTYYTIYEKLLPIVDEDEGEAVCAVVDSVWNSKKFRYKSKSPLAKAAVDRLQRGLRCLPFSHEDIHWGNIMKTESSYYKLIDFESFQHRIV